MRARRSSHSDERAKADRKHAVTALAGGGVLRRTATASRKTFRELGADRSVRLPAATGLERDYRRHRRKGQAAHHALDRGRGSSSERPKGPVAPGQLHRNRVMRKLPVITNERLIGGAFRLNGAGRVARPHARREWGMLENADPAHEHMSVGKVFRRRGKGADQAPPGIGTDEESSCGVGSETIVHLRRGREGKFARIT